MAHVLQWHYEIMIIVTFYDNAQINLQDLCFCHATSKKSHGLLKPKENNLKENFPCMENRYR